MILQLLVAALNTPVPAPAPTIGAELRTVIATEQLVTATWAIVLVGFLTLIAAAFAAVAAMRTYFLESKPGLVFSEALPESHYVRRLPGYMIDRDGSRAPAAPGDEPSPPILYKLQANDARAAGAELAAFEVRNVGRSAVVDLAVCVRVSQMYFDKVASFHADPSGAKQILAESVGTGELKIASIAPNESVFVPFASKLMNAGIKVLSVTAATPAETEAESARTVLPFVASELRTGAAFY